MNLPGGGLRDRRLNWVIASSALSNLGDGIGKVAFPLLGATLTREPVLIAGLSATAFLPWLLFAVLSGALVDRVDRRRAIVLANLTRAAVVGVLGTLLLFDAVSIWLVYLAALLVGTVETVADSASNALIPSVVPRAGLERANSKLQAAELLGQNFLGGPIGSATFALFAAAPFLLNSAGFAIAAAVVLGLAGNYRPGLEPGVPARRLRQDLAEGFRWLRVQPLVRALVFIVGAVAFTGELAQSLLVLYALEDVGLAAAMFGVFALVAGIGGLLGAALTPRLTGWLSRSTVLIGALCLCAIGFGGMGLFPSPVAAAVLFGLFGFGVISVNVILGTLRHALVPSRLLGRVIGVWRTVAWGAIPVGALAGGVLAELFGDTRSVFLVSGGAQVLLTVGVVFILRRHRHVVDTLSAAGEDDTAR